MSQEQRLPLPSAPPQYSFDGRWWWDGAQWIPVQVSGAARKRNTGLVIAVVAAGVLACVLLLGVASAMFGQVGSTKPMGPKLDKQYCEYWPEDC